MLSIDDPTQAAALRSRIVDVVTQALAALNGGCVDDTARSIASGAVDRAVAALAASQVVDSTEFYASQIDEQRNAWVCRCVRRGRGIADGLGLATKRSPVVASRAGWPMPGRWSPTCRQRSRRSQAVGCRSWGRRSRSGNRLPDRRGPPAGRRELAGESGRHVDRADRAGRSGGGRRNPTGGRRGKERAGPRGPARDDPAAGRLYGPVSALVPVERGVAVYAALRAAARSAHLLRGRADEGAGHGRHLVERVTGQSFAASVPLEIGLIITDNALTRVGPRHPPSCPATDRSRPRSHAQLACAAASGDRGPRIPMLTDATRARALGAPATTDPIDGTVTSIGTRRRPGSAGRSRS